MYDAYETLENTCERAMRELRDLNKKLSKDESTASKEDVELMESLTHTVASCKKGIAMMEKYSTDDSSKRYRRGYSTRNKSYFRDNDVMARLDSMYQNARDDQEADIIRSIMNELN